MEWLKLKQDEVLDLRTDEAIVETRMLAQQNKATNDRMKWEVAKAKAEANARK